MSSNPQNQNPDPKSPEIQNPDLKSPENQPQQISDQPTTPIEKGLNQNDEKQQEDDEEEEEEGECGFCLFMKGGGCKEAFVNWEKCVEEGEKNKEDIAEKCFEVTGNLKKCMEAHAEYYEPILRAEKAADEELKQELDRDSKENEKGKGNDGPDAVEETVQIEVTKEG